MTGNMDFNRFLQCLRIVKNKYPSLLYISMIFDIMGKKAAAEIQKGAKIMDIKAKIEEIVKKLQSDKTLLAKFQKDP